MLVVRRRLFKGVGTGGGGARRRTSRRRGEMGARLLGLQKLGAELDRRRGEVAVADGDRRRGDEEKNERLELEKEPPRRRAESCRPLDSPSPSRRAASQVSADSYVAGGSSQVS